MIRTLFFRFLQAVSFHLSSLSPYFHILGAESNKYSLFFGRKFAEVMGAIAGGIFLRNYSQGRGCIFFFKLVKNIWNSTH